MRLPVWFKQKIPSDTALFYLRRLKEKKLNTVCQSARCPNWSDCFKEKNFTFMILGDSCSRNCCFCAIKKAHNLNIDLDEPNRLADFVAEFNLEYVVVTSVSRDDLKDKGAGVFFEVVRLLKEKKKDIKIELLIPDFLGDLESLKLVIESKPHIIGHNLETVQRLYPQIKPQADYQRSLWIIKKIKDIDNSIITKSSLMLGLGEKEEEVYRTFKDLRRAGCDILCLGQYLSPHTNSYPVKEFVSLEKFNKYKELALGLGFLSVISGPLVRSSYKARLLYSEIKRCTN